MTADIKGTKFGSCCEILKDVLQKADEFEPLIAEEDPGILYMSIGLMAEERDDEPNMVDHPVFFCPFCGTKLQTRGGGRGQDWAREAGVVCVRSLWV